MTLSRDPQDDRPALKVPGTYKIPCTFHEEDDMRMTIFVRKRR